MTVKITIIGLGQIGASIGLALAGHKNQVTTLGYDKAAEVGRKAQKMGAVENVAHGLLQSIKDADVVILALPLDQVQETLESIGPRLDQRTVVFDTAPVKEAVAAWVEEFLPSKRYVGLTPAINAQALDDTQVGIDAARADLFQNGVVAISAPHGTDEEAIKLAASFVTLLGARAYFADQAEVDGIMAAVHTLPALVAAALAEAVIGQPGWSDIRKLAGRPFTAALRLYDAEDPTALAEAARKNRANTVRLLDDTIAALKSMRDDIEADGKKGLRVRLEQALKEADQWRQARADGDWQAIENSEQEIPTFSDLWMQQLGLGKLLGGLRPRKKDED